MQGDITQRSPAYSLIVDGTNITNLVNQRLISLTLTDNRGFEADTLDLVLDDADGALELPRKGAKVQVAIGWADTGTVDKGSYVVDELEHSGAPDQLTIRARSADLREGLTTKRDQSWHDTTLGQLVSDIAARNELQPAVSENLASVPIEHIDQTNESDANLLSRLADWHGAAAMVKDDRLLFIASGSGKSASGKPLPAISITRQDGDRHRFAVADREAYTAVRAYYFDLRQAKRGEVLVNDKAAQSLREKPAKASDNQEPPDPSVSDTGNIKALRHTYATKDNAMRAAQAAWARLQRGVATLSITLAEGRPDLMPELPASVSGIKPQIDAIDWTLIKVMHSITDNGYTTALELETKLPQEQDTAQAQDERARFEQIKAEWLAELKKSGDLIKESDALADQYTAAKAAGDNDAAQKFKAQSQEKLDQSQFIRDAAKAKYHDEYYRLYPIYGKG
jgi:phage protein D